MQVSSDTKEKLELYLSLLRKWQPKINLISNNTLDDAWHRHFEDSLQMLELLPSKRLTLMDIGSGAGFPGLVLAIARDDLNVHLIESDQKKCAFLKTVSRETKIEVTVHNTRIENVSREIKPDVICARALASLEQLFDYCADWISENANVQLIFPKGENADIELKRLEEKWQFNCRTYQSKTDSSAKILIFSDICAL